MQALATNKAETIEQALNKVGQSQQQRSNSKHPTGHTDRYEVRVTQYELSKVQKRQVGTAGCLK